MANNVFAERLTQLRNEKKLKREDVAKVLDCSVSAVGNYENGNRTPDFDGLIALADFFETTTDYLLGRTDIKTSDKDLKFVCEYTGLSEVSINRLVSDFKNGERFFPAKLEGYSAIDVVDRFISKSYFYLMVMQTLEYSTYKYKGDILSFQSSLRELRERALAMSEHLRNKYPKKEKIPLSDIIEAETISNGYLYSIQKTVADFAEDFYLTCIFGVPEGGDSNGNNPKEE